MHALPSPERPVDADSSSDLAMNVRPVPLIPNPPQIPPLAPLPWPAPPVSPERTALTPTSSDFGSPNRAIGNSANDELQTIQTFSNPRELSLTQQPQGSVPAAAGMGGSSPGSLLTTPVLIHKLCGIRPGARFCMHGKLRFKLLLPHNLTQTTGWLSLRGSLHPPVLLLLMHNRMQS